jgi:hypothetical protein
LFEATGHAGVGEGLLHLHTSQQQPGFSVYIDLVNV